MLKSLLPPPVNSFMREINRIMTVEEKSQKQIEQLKKQIECQEEIYQKCLKAVADQYINLLKEFETQQEYILGKKIVS